MEIILIAAKGKEAKHTTETKAASVNEHERTNGGIKDRGTRMQYYIVTKQEREGER